MAEPRPFDQIAPGLLLYPGAQMPVWSEDDLRLPRKAVTIFSALLEVQITSLSAFTPAEQLM